MVRLLLVSVLMVCAPVHVATAGPAHAGGTEAFAVVLADGGVDSSDGAHDHGSGWGPAALLDRVLHAGPLAAPFLLISTVMLVANRRANRLGRASRVDEEDGSAGAGGGKGT